MQGIIRLPKTWLNKVHKQKSAWLLFSSCSFSYLFSFFLFAFEENLLTIEIDFIFFCFYYFYFDFVLCFRLFCALFSSRFALNCCCNAVVFAGGRRKRERGGGPRATCGSYFNLQPSDEVSQFNV